MMRFVNLILGSVCFMIGISYVADPVVGAWIGVGVFNLSVAFLKP